MAIPIEHESEECVKEWPNTIEDCVFCGKETRWWNNKRNKPVCPVCAKRYRAKDIDKLEKNEQAYIELMTQVWRGA